MLFTSWIYILFLIVTVFLYWKTPQRYRIGLLLVASYIFYMSWSPPFGLIYGPVIFLDSLYFYWLSKAMTRWPRFKKQLLILGVSSELLLLAYFKYTNLIIETCNAFLSGIHLPPLAWESHLFLPLAISFTNFILISYLVDIYRGNEKPDTFIRFSTYVAFFPHLIAGPIVRASELLHQFDHPPDFSMERIVKGMHRFLAGMGMKLFIADQLAPYVNMIYSDSRLQGFDSGWLATYAFAVQIFCDFAGYTLMAQGSAMTLGFTLPENFNAPYFSKNITDFWRRWHMSLSRWLRDYLYIPLGGSRHSRFRTYLNLFLTMGLGGLWHGANWTFVCWGLYQGLLLSLHKCCVHFRLNRFIPVFMAHLLTFHVVCVGWVFFRAQHFSEAISMLSVMFNPATMVGLSGQGKLTTLLVLFYFLGHGVVRSLSGKVRQPWIISTLQGVTYFVLLYLGITMTTRQQEFIYFQF